MIFRVPVLVSLIAFIRSELANYLCSSDIFAFAQAGGDLGLLTDEIIKISVGEANAVLATTDTPSSGFEIRAARERDWGAFASRPFTRGDLILVETPLYSVHEDPNPDEVLRAVERLTHTERSSVAQLKNAYAEDPLYPDPFVGVHSTNAFAAGEDQSVLCLRASRFNHSCSPNARHSWHAPSKTFRIYALRPIAAGDEILVCYISGRNVYGSTRAQRQARLKHKLAFTCACTVCALPEPERAASDRRREEVAGLWETVPYFMPHQIVDRLETIALGVRLMREEGYCADADDFTNDAAAICGYHSDWVAVRYWALETYATRVAEFGGDSLHVTKAEMQTLLFRPQEYQMAGMGKRMVLDVRL